MANDGDGYAERDHHADPQASEGDARIVVEESGLGLDIIRQQYGMAKYENGETWYDWTDGEKFHIRADMVPELLDGIESADVDYLQDSLKGMHRIERALSGDSHE